MRGDPSRGDSEPSPAIGESLEGTGVSVLLADDDDALREVLQMHLESRGYEVHVASDGEQALALATELLPAIAILDIVMPLANGWDVARTLRLAPETKDIRLLMLSGIGEDVLGPNLAILGGDLGLDKPFDLDELDEALRILRSR